MEDKNIMHSKIKKTGNLKIVKKSGFIILSAVLLFSIISMITVMVIYNNQFPRYDRHDMSVNAGLKYEDIKDNYPRELVNFKSGKNKLQGYFYNNNSDLGLIVVSHGIGGGADSYLPQIIYFLDEGFNVFAYDATGSFDSEGKSTRGFPQSLLDLDAALAYINSQKESEDLDVFLFGHSWGGYAVANILHFDHDIAGVVSVSGANSPMDIIIEQGQSMMGDFIIVQYPFLWLYQKILFGEAVNLNAVDAINNSDIPIMIIHGTEDDFVLYDGSSVISHSDEIKRPDVKFISLSSPGKNGHNDLFRSEKALEYIEKINIEYRKLYDSYNRNIPYEKRQEFYRNIDRGLVQDLDTELMGEIVNFFLQYQSTS